jgi:hypothetical protein
MSLIALPMLIFALGAISPASASLIFDGQITVAGEGFGTTNTVLTFHNDGLEQGCVKWSGTADAFDAPCPGLVTAGLVEEDKSQTLTLSTLSSVLGITSAGELGIVFNPAQSGGNEVTLNKLVLTFYSPDGLTSQSLTWLGGPVTYCCDNNGTGGAGQVFKLDWDQWNLVQTAWFTGVSFGDNRIGVGAEIGGPTGNGTFGGTGSFERFYIAKVDPAPIPEPISFLTIGSGLVGLRLLSRRRRKKRS